MIDYRSLNEVIDLRKFIKYIINRETIVFNLRILLGHHQSGWYQKNCFGEHKYIDIDYLGLNECNTHIFLNYLSLTDPRGSQNYMYIGQE